MGMFTVTRRYSFSASHSLTHLADSHPEHPEVRGHGHTYEVELTVSSSGRGLNAFGFVVGPGGLDDFGAYIAKALDRRCLNDVLGSSIATTPENIAHHLYDIAAEILDEERGGIAVRVSDRPGHWVAITPDEAALDGFSSVMG